MKKQLKVIVEKHPDGYVAYPLGCKGVVVGEGDRYDDAVADWEASQTDAAHESKRDREMSE